MGWKKLTALVVSAVMSIVCGVLPVGGNLPRAEQKEIVVKAQEEGLAVRELCLGESISAAISENGSLYIWGSNYNGQFGDGTTSDSYVPIKVMDNVLKVSLGSTHSGAVTEDGSLYMWGWNYTGQLGDGTTTDSLVPIKIMDHVKDFSLGEDHSAVVIEDGSLYLWGCNEHGQLGNNSYTNSLIPVKVLDDVVSVMLGEECSAAITEDGSLFTWGSLGYGTVTDQLTPTKLLDNVVDISFGYMHNAAITEDGSLYMWGHNENGQLGDGTSEWRLTPVKVMERIAAVSLGNYHSAAVTEDGDLYSWGSYALGHESITSSETPLKIMENVKSISCGQYFTSAITRDGSLYMWGNNECGQLGDGTFTWYQTPIKVMDNIAEVSVRDYYSAAVTEDGSLYMWGDNISGQLGNGTTENSLVPVKVEFPGSNDNFASGICGDNLIWILDDAGKLIISGSGDMYDWRDAGEEPWKDYWSSIQEIVIEEGVTSIGSKAFGGCNRLTTATIPKSVNRIGDNSFEYCENLEDVHYASSRKQWVTIDIGDGNECLENARIHYQVELPSLSVSIYGDNSTFISEGTNNTITETVYIKNSGNATAKNAYVEIILPNKMTFSDTGGSQRLTYFAELYAQEMARETWGIEVSPSIHSGIYPIKIICGADDVDETVLRRYITVSQGYANDNRIRWGEDNLSFTNSPNYYTAGTWDWSAILLGGKPFYREHNYYYISDIYFYQLIKGMSYTVVDTVIETMQAPWGGSCYGMSAVEALMKSGYLTPSYWQRGATVPHDFDAPKDNLDIETLINFYNLSQMLPDVMNERESFDVIQYDATMPFDSNDAVSLKQLVNEAKKVKYGGLPVLIGFSWMYMDSGVEKTAGHAMIAYDVMEGSFEAEDGNTYQYCVLVSDPNADKPTELYIAGDYSSWYYYGMSTTSGGADKVVKDSYGNECKVMDQVVSSPEIMDIRNPETGADRTILKDYNENFIIDYAKSVSSVSSDEKSAAIKGWMSEGDLAIRLLPSFGITGDGENGGNNIIIVPDGDAAYTITPKEESNEIYASLVYDNYSLKVQSASGDSATFDPSGSVTLNGNSGDYELGATFDDGYGDLPWFSVKVYGSNAENATLSMGDEGMIFTSNNMLDAEIVAYNLEQAVMVQFSTEDESVQIKAVDKETLGVYIDTDGNGTYETLIAESGEEEAEVVLGDVNGDGEIDASDATAVLVEIAVTGAGSSGTFTEAQFAAADINRNGNIEVSDASVILVYIAMVGAGEKDVKIENLV